MTRALLVVLAILGSSAVAVAAPRFPPRPDGTSECIADAAGVIKEQHRAEINQIAHRLRAEKDTPIIVVTIDSIESRDPAGPDIESYATALFDEWGIGRPDHNVGILLLVSIADRKARIELGADWGSAGDVPTSDIMQIRIVPEFEAGRPSMGILQGVRGLAAFARRVEPGSGDTPIASIIIGGLLASMVILAVVRRNRRAAEHRFPRSRDGVKVPDHEALRGVPRRNWRRFLRRGGPGTFGGGSTGGSSGGSYGGGSSGGGGSTGGW